MRNFKGIIFLTFLLLYGIGVCIGSARQILVSDQQGMYEYLENAMSGYDVTAMESVKSVLKDNMKLFFCLLVGGFFLVGPVILTIVMLVKGYSVGFAITTVLRFFGMRGLVYCMANLISAAILVPVMCWYSCKSAENVKEMRYDRQDFLKRFFFLSLVILVVLVIDSGLRGYLSALFLKIGNNG